MRRKALITIGIGLYLAAVYFTCQASQNDTTWVMRSLFLFLLLAGVIALLVWSLRGGKAKNTMQPQATGMASSIPATRSIAEWFYEDAGRRLGPVTTEAIGTLLGQGRISYDTLIWKSAFGQHWKPLRETELVPADMPPPLPASRINNSFAWLLALIPLIGAFGERVAADMWNIRLAALDAVVLYTVINCALAITDARQISKSGRNTKHLTLGIWCWLIPLYLFQRSRVLNQSFIYCGVWICAFVASAVMENPTILSEGIYWGTGLPPCDSSYAQKQAKAVFNSIPIIHLAGTQAIDMRDAAEISSSKTQRSCKATFIGSNATDYRVNYTLENQNDRILIRLKIEE